MNVDIISTSCGNPLETVGRIAGTSYGRTDPKVSRAVNCWRAGHLSVFEHVSATFAIEGISRACSHQLVRHRLASFCQRSQRYTRLEGGDWYVIPPSIAGSDSEQAYRGYMAYARTRYESLIADGLKPEDARFVLPEACKTDIAVTMNARELMSFCALRLDAHAQWEIRELAGGDAGRAGGTGRPVGRDSRLVPPPGRIAHTDNRIRRGSLWERKSAPTSSRSSTASTRGTASS